MAIMHFFLNKKKCAGSLCSVHSGLSECTLTGDLSSSSTDKFALCLVACTGASTGNTCKPTSSIDAFGGRQVSLRAGTPCAGTQGYCDMFGRCRAVDEEGPFSRLTSSLIGILNLTASDVASWAVVSVTFTHHNQDMSSSSSSHKEYFITQNSRLSSS